MFENNIVLTDNFNLKELIRETIAEVIDERLPAMPLDKREYYTRFELAEKWKVSLVSLWRYDKMGLIHHVMIGGHVRYLKKEIDAIVTFDIPKDRGIYKTKAERNIQRRIEEELKERRHKFDKGK